MQYPYLTTLGRAIAMPYPKLLLLGVQLILTGCGHAEPADAEFAVHFGATFLPDKGATDVTIRLSQDNGALRGYRFRAPPARYQLVTDDGSAVQNAGYIDWQPPASGGTLRYRIGVDNKRGDGYDARMHADWVLLRLDDLFPSATVRTVKGAQGESSMQLDGPANWRFETPYGNSTDTLVSIVGARKVPSPRGWLVGGEIGVRRDVISGRRVAIAAPQGSNFRRLDVLTFLRWTLPELTRAVPTLPERILIVGAPSSMWRGGLSAPGSLYLHVERPLVSENATSTLLHELMHIAGLHGARQGADWIVEGMAELYSLLVLRRSGGISTQRFDATLTALAEWAERENGKLTHPSKGADTAAAVLYLNKVANALRTQGRSIDGLLAALLDGSDISNERMHELLSERLGAEHPLLAALPD
ncbi:MAG: hypothetical protein AAF513_05390 [Pseudomonadota bacterium]